LSEEFREVLKLRARGPAHLGPLDPELCERALDLMLRGRATPAQIGGFLLVGRAAGDSPAELAGYARVTRALVRELPPSAAPTVTVAGSFDGKLRTFNVGAAAALLTAAAGARVLLVGEEAVPPKEGRTVFDALRGLGAEAPQLLPEAARSLEELGFAATTTRHYLPELHALLDLRRELARRTVLNVVEKLLSPVPGSRLAVRITHRSFLRSVPTALAELGEERALVYQAVEGSDEAPLDGSSALVRVERSEVEEFRVAPESLGLSRATKADIPWRGAEDESRSLRDALGGERGPVRDLILYNAALRLLVAGAEDSLRECAERARPALDSGAALELLERFSGALPKAALSGSRY
jgi:anthranilate phosphoribosyltransferase